MAGLRKNAACSSLGFCASSPERVVCFSLELDSTPYSRITILVNLSRTTRRKFSFLAFERYADFISFFPIEYETLSHEDRLYSYQRVNSFANSHCRYRSRLVCDIIHPWVISAYEFASPDSRTRKRWSLEKMEAAIARRIARVDRVVNRTVKRFTGKRDRHRRWWVKARVAPERKAGGVATASLTVNASPRGGHPAGWLGRTLDAHQRLSLVSCASLLWKSIAFSRLCR